MFLPCSYPDTPFGIPIVDSETAAAAKAEMEMERAVLQHQTHIEAALHWRGRGR